jgi:hypothetical protein
LASAFKDALLHGVVTGVPNPEALVKTANPGPGRSTWVPERVERYKVTGDIPVRSWPEPTTCSPTSSTTPPPKSGAGNHDVAIDLDTVTVLTTAGRRVACGGVISPGRSTGRT